MPLLMLIIGGALILLSTRGDPRALGNMIAEDFSGSRGFAAMALGFIIVGAVGLYEPLRGVSRAFLFLMFVVLILANGRNGLISKAATEWRAIIGDPYNGQSRLDLEEALRRDNAGRN